MRRNTAGPTKHNMGTPRGITMIQPNNFEKDSPQDKRGSDLTRTSYYPSSYVYKLND